LPWRNGVQEAEGSFYQQTELKFKEETTGWAKISVHLMITIKYLAQYECLVADRQDQGDTRLTLAPSVILNYNYVIMVSDWNCLTYFCEFFYSNYQINRVFLLLLCVIFWVVPRRVVFNSRRFGTMSVPSSEAIGYEVCEGGQLCCGGRYRQA
jgi:hypothetical protein